MQGYAYHTRGIGQYLPCVYGAAMLDAAHFDEYQIRMN